MSSNQTTWSPDDLDSDQPLDTALSVFVSLLETRCDGPLSPIKNSEHPDGYPLDPMIQYWIATIKSIKEFQVLQKKDGPWMQRWRELEDVCKNWEGQDKVPDKSWFREIETLYFEQKMGVWS